jgi:hypothetical protein
MVHEFHSKHELEELVQLLGVISEKTLKVLSFVGLSVWTQTSPVQVYRFEECRKSRRMLGDIELVALFVANTRFENHGHKPQVADSLKWVTVNNDNVG